jgi:uncharacterized protein (TIGR02647 family)
VSSEYKIIIETFSKSNKNHPNDSYYYTRFSKSDSFNIRNKFNQKGSKIMSLTPELLDELKILNMFDLNSTQGGLKVHHDAETATIEAAARLHDKGMTTLPDGGYLTDRGVETAEHVQVLVKMLLADK